MRMKKYRFALTYLALVGFTLLIGAGCGSVSADQACTDQAKAQCGLLDKCRKEGTQLTYGSLGACISRLKTSCMTGLMAPSAGNDSGAIESCAQALPSESCADYLQSNPVAACIPKNGNLEGGSACAFNTQCKSGFCAVLKGGNCGKCQNQPVVGDPCTDYGCGRNLVCTANQVCASWAMTGGSCDAKNNVCVPGLACVIAATQTAGTCQPKGTTIGATCDNKRQTGPDCDANAGLFCNTTTLKCAAETYVNPTEECGSGNLGTTYARCNNGGDCITTSSGTPATCVGAVDAGNSCDTVMGPPCLGPARCVVSSGGTSGTCMLLDGTMCM